MLQKGHLENCYKEYCNPKRALPDAMYMGYMEACLVQFGILKSKDNGLADYAITKRRKFLFWVSEVKETRYEVILRLVKDYLEN
jgi:hypothetical protein